jgi:hypothetical protein
MNESRSFFAAFKAAVTDSTLRGSAADVVVAFFESDFTCRTAAPAASFSLFFSSCFFAIRALRSAALCFLPIFDSPFFIDSSPSSLDGARGVLAARINQGRIQASYLRAPAASAALFVSAAAEKNRRWRRH